MPTVCKISLDAAEYRKELDAVVSESRAAAATLESVGGTGTAPAVSTAAAPDTAPLQALADNPPEITVPAKVEPDTTELQALTDAPPEITVPAKVEPDTAPLEELAAAPPEIIAPAKVEPDPATLEKLPRQVPKLVIPAKVEVDAASVEKLGGKLDGTTGKMSKFSAMFKNMSRSNPGESLERGATAVSAIGTAAGVSVPPVGMLGAAVKALFDPIAIVTAAIALLVAIVTAAWNALTVSTEEYAAKQAALSDAAQKQIDKTRELDAAAQGYGDRLREINALESAGAAAKAETAQILGALQKQYGDLGAEVDATTGKVTNLIEVEARLSAARGMKKAEGYEQLREAEMGKARAAYVQAGDAAGIWGWRSKKDFDAMAETMSPERMAKHLRQRAQNSSDGDEIAKLLESAASLENADAVTKKRDGNIRNGFDTQKEYDDALGKSRGAAESAEQSVTAAKKRAVDRTSDDEFNDLRDIDDKKANRAARVNAELEKQAELTRNLANAKDEAQKAEESLNPMSIADARKKVADAELAIESSKDRQYALSRQIQQLDKARADAVKKITDQASYELEYNKLIVDGEFQKAAALKLEKELRDQNLKLTKEEKQAILDQRAALEKQSTGKMIEDAKDEVRLQQLLLDGRYAEYEALKLQLEMKRQGKELTKEETAEILKQREALRAQQLQNVLRDQGETLRGQAMEMSGRGDEYAMDKAMRDARDKKGGDLTEGEADQVRQLVELQQELANFKDINLGDLSVKSNSLTARGGFATGAAAPDPEKVNREIANHSKKQAELLAKVVDFLDGMKE